MLDTKYLEEVLTNPKAHWDTLEESKARKRIIATQFQGKNMLDDYGEEFGCMSNELAMLVRF